VQKVSKMHLGAVLTLFGFFMTQYVSRNFSWNFCDFSSIFVPLKQFLDFLELFMALQINSKKKEKNLSYWNGPSPKARPAPAHPPRASWSPSGPSAVTPWPRRRRSIGMGMSA
jgi:hypothetical protein